MRTAATTAFHTAASAPGYVPALRRLYVVRFGFAVVWAILLVLTGQQLGPVVAVLVVAYPLFDAVCAAIDARGSKTSLAAARTATSWGPPLNIAVSLVATVALGVAATSGIPGVLRVWGVWAVVAGLIQLGVGITRRALGGQWPMILSGGISVLAGTSFYFGAGATDPSLLNVAGYAALGGIFFLVSALRLGRTTAGR